ncbi:hypothetical protein NPIL_290681 [Nephila pilipes]|uniref:Uncharacterized protein n=1 Tax=Nephila pilipes TaxID=299642 RepID=A0A8X6QXB0_NEPPI|nr:hypothetical protein NPIL_290681 [Nephila pilipes]
MLKKKSIGAWDSLTLRLKKDGEKQRRGGEGILRREREKAILQEVSDRGCDLSYSSARENDFSEIFAPTNTALHSSDSLSTRKKGKLIRSK